MSSLPPAGWYDDPEQFGTLRYWDGAQWTQHRAPGHGAAASSTSSTGLSSIGSWLQTSVSALWDQRIPIGILVGLSSVLWLALGLTATWAVDGLIWTVDGGWTGVDTGRLVITGVVAVVNVVVGFVVYLAITDQVVWDRLGEPRSVTRSLGAALVALPRLIGWSLVLVLAVIGGVFVIAVFSLVTPLLGVIAGLGALVAMVWLYVKVAFLLVACVAPARATNALSASAEVSRGRFWAVFGRLLVVGLISGAISFAMSIPLSATGPTQEDIDEAVVVVDDELVAFDVGALAGIAGFEPGLTFVASAIVQALTPLMALAAIAVLYTEVHGRPDHSA